MTSSTNNPNVPFYFDPQLSNYKINVADRKSASALAHTLRQFFDLQVLYYKKHMELLQVFQLLVIFFEKYNYSINSLMYILEHMIKDKIEVKEGDPLKPIGVPIPIDFTRSIIGMLSDQKKMMTQVGLFKKHLGMQDGGFERRGDHVILPDDNMFLHANHPGLFSNVATGATGKHFTYDGPNVQYYTHINMPPTIAYLDDYFTMEENDLSAYNYVPGREVNVATMWGTPSHPGTYPHGTYGNRNPNGHQDGAFTVTLKPIDTATFTGKFHDTKGNAIVQLRNIKNILAGIANQWHPTDVNKGNQIRTLSNNINDYITQIDAQADDVIINYYLPQLPDSPPQPVVPAPAPDMFMPHPSKHIFAPAGAAHTVDHDPQYAYENGFKYHGTKKEALDTLKKLKNEIHAERPKWSTHRDTLTAGQPDYHRAADITQQLTDQNTRLQAQIDDIRNAKKQPGNVDLSDDDIVNYYLAPRPPKAP
jgi:hypothetical protein